MEEKIVELPGTVLLPEIYMSFHFLHESGSRQKCQQRAAGWRT
jgi:hypothetical protein